VTVQHKVGFSLDGQTSTVVRRIRQHIAVLTNAVSWFKKVVTRKVFYLLLGVLYEDHLDRFVTSYQRLSCL
jgi:hypothetical protein